MTLLPHPPIAAARRVRVIDDLWISRNPAELAPDRSADKRRCHLTGVLLGHPAIRGFLTRKRPHELDRHLLQEPRSTCGARLALRLACDRQDGFGNWDRSLGIETLGHDVAGPNRQRIARINDPGIAEQGRLFHWPPVRRPRRAPGPADLRLYEKCDDRYPCGDAAFSDAVEAVQTRRISRGLCPALGEGGRTPP